MGDYSRLMMENVRLEQYVTELKVQSYHLAELLQDSRDENERLRLAIHTIAGEAEQLGMPKLAAHWRREAGDDKAINGLLKRIAELEDERDIFQRTLDKRDEEQREYHKRIAGLEASLRACTVRGQAYKEGYARLEEQIIEMQEVIDDLEHDHLR
jgi:chromosome segregation ATPase